jgi:hypothetical protein
VLEGVIRNLEARMKKKHGDNAQTQITLDKVMGTLKEFMNEMASKYAVLDRPPNVQSSLPPKPTDQVNEKPEEIKKQENQVTPTGET